MIEKYYTNSYIYVYLRMYLNKCKHSFECILRNESYMCACL